MNAKTERNRCFRPSSGSAEKGRLEQFVADGIARGVGTTAGADLGVDVSDVMLYGAEAEGEIACDLAVEPAGSEEAKHFYLPIGKTIRMRG
jgi:hypothetical protein